MSMNYLSNLSSEEQIKTYFEKVFELQKSNEPFPVNLDMVWPLVYSRKDHAVRALFEGGMQGVDYKHFPINGDQNVNFASKSDQNDENLHFSYKNDGKKNKNRGGRDKDDYKISVPCMEWLIARKVRAVFEVYRRVFHHSVDSPAWMSGIRTVDVDGQCYVPFDLIRERGKFVHLNGKWWISVESCEIFSLLKYAQKGKARTAPFLPPFDMDEITNNPNY